MLSKRELDVIDRHGEMIDGKRVEQWDGMFSVYYKRTGKMWVHDVSPRKSSQQELYFHSIDSTAGTLTRTHPIKLWDLRRCLTARETARLQGFPESFHLPTTCYNQLFGNAVAVPCAEYAMSCVLDGRERTYLDICSGIGGFSVAAKTVVPSMTCVGFSEIRRAAIACYEHNFPGVVSLGDARKVVDWPQADAVFAGFPCQPFSTANPHKNAQTHNAADFFEVILYAIRSSGCTRVVLENVCNLMTVGRTQWESLQNGLMELGFNLEYGVLRADCFGLPQTRKRLYVVGKRGGRPRKLNPPPCDTKRRIGDIIEKSNTTDTFSGK